MRFEGFEIIDVAAQTAAVEWGRPAFADIPSFQRTARAHVKAALAERGVAPAGPELTFSCPPEGGTLRMAPGVIVAGAFEPVGEVAPQAIPAGRAVHLRYAGPYEGLGEAWMALGRWVAEQGLEHTGLGWEIYGDPSIPVTDLYSMVK